MNEFSEQDFNNAPPPPKKEINPIFIPAAIVLAGLLVAGAVFFSKTDPQPVSPVPAPTGSVTDIRPVSSDDHIQGNPNANIVFIEYSDFECPFCGNFHQTMKQIIEKYGASGQVAWVYRQFPIEQLHQQAWREAMASECAAELGGNEAFWSYADLIFENNNGGNDGLDLTLLSDFAEQIGLSREAFNVCLESERTRPLVEEDYNEAVERAGARGTPHNVIIANGEMAPIPGAQPYEAIDGIIRSILDPESFPTPSHNGQ